MFKNISIKLERGPLSLEVGFHFLVPMPMAHTGVMAGLSDTEII